MEVVGLALYQVLVAPVVVLVHHQMLQVQLVRRVQLMSLALALTQLPLLIRLVALFRVWLLLQLY